MIVLQQQDKVKVPRVHSEGRLLCESEKKISL